MGLTVRHVEAVRKGARVQLRGLSTRDRHPRFTLSDQASLSNSLSFVHVITNERCLRDTSGMILYD